MHTAVESTSDRGTDPPPMRIQPPSIDGQAPVAGTLAGRPAATIGAQRGALLHAGLGSWSDDEVRLKRSIDGVPSWTAHRRTSGYVSNELSEWDKMKYVTERRQRSDIDGLLLKSPGDFCMYQDITEEPHLSAMRSDRGTPIVLTEEQLSSLFRRASEVAYTSTIRK